MGRFGGDKLNRPQKLQLNCRKEPKSRSVFLDNLTKKKCGNLERIKYESKVLPKYSSLSPGHAIPKVRSSPLP